MSARTIEDLLPDSLLEDLRSRAGDYDARNAFFAEDFADLRETGYLSAPVPEELGGAGLRLEQLVTAQRRLATAAPATALGINMHLVWVQVARFLSDRDIDTLDWVLDDAVAGEVFAFGISEAGNDAVLMDAVSTAVREEYGYEISGTKIFTTLSPVWTRLGVHAKHQQPATDVREEGTEELVFGFVRRDRTALAAANGIGDTTEGSSGLVHGSITHPGEWNPLGMRATQSWTTVLDRVRMADSDVAAVMPPFEGTHPLVLGIFSSFSLLTAAVYAGIADRALEIASEAARTPTGAQRDDADEVRLDDPDTASRLTAALLDHRSSLEALELLARDIDEQRPRTDWPLALAACRNRVTDEARRAIDVAMRLVGARGFQADSELARLYRDVLAGLFHPSSSRALAASMRAAVSGRG
ncbi:acyl-CoA dehydrogenase family protein [Leucobacter sp. GX24907]